MDRMQLPGSSQGQERPTQRPDDGMGGIPDHSDEGNLVREELDQEQQPGGSQHQGMAEDLQFGGKPRDPLEALAEAQSLTEAQE